MVTTSRWEPTKLSEFVGQTNLIKRLQTEIKSARYHHKQMRHAVFSGPEGVGKSLLPRLLAKEFGSPLSRGASIPASAGRFKTSQQLPNLYTTYVALNASPNGPSTPQDNGKGGGRPRPLLEGSRHTRQPVLRLSSHRSAGVRGTAPFPFGAAGLRRQRTVRLPANPARQGPAKPASAPTGSRGMIRSVSSLRTNASAAFACS
jgi:DNA polymerase III delta prime subunit